MANLVRNTIVDSAMVDHWEFKQAVHNYKLKSGHAINYYDGGQEQSGPIMHPGSPNLDKKIQKVSNAKEKMRDILGRADYKSSVGSKRRNVLGTINDVK